ncbi:MAG: zinc-dependent alcohol dehydrogenase family protein [Desulfobulbaceae bacterium]|nr:zinc-dependent alcohol dehydrogenase family protein [Desulfobulbaceae bacterium]
MKALVLERLADLTRERHPLQLKDLPVPVPAAGEILIRVNACGVCHTEIDEIEGRAVSRLPVVPGHQVVGKVEKTGPEANLFQPGTRVGVGWIFSACGACPYCLKGLENLCPDFRGTGMDADGGYAEYMTVPDRFACRIPDVLSDYETAPLLCAGAIGYRSLRLANLHNGENIGLTGFGGSGHLVLKMIRYKFPDSRVFVFARNPREQAFALELGASWAGDIPDPCPERMQAIIDTTPVWKPVLASLDMLAPGGRLVINAIRKESTDQNALLQLDYSKHLWQEKEIKSVANVTRADIVEFLELAAASGIRPDYELYPMEEANRALHELKTGKIRGAKVLQIA